MNSRFTEFCGKRKIKQIFKSSQNVALIQYRMPAKGTSFGFSVRFIKNPTRKCHSWTKQRHDFQPTVYFYQLLIFFCVSVFALKSFHHSHVSLSEGRFPMQILFHACIIFSVQRPLPIYWRYLHFAKLRQKGQLQFEYPLPGRCEGCFFEHRYRPQSRTRNRARNRHHPQGAVAGIACQNK